MSNKMDELLSGIKIGEIIRSNREEERKYNKWIAVIAVLGVAVLVAAVAYTTYKLLTPDDLDDEFEDDFDDSFNDFDEDEDEDDEVIEPVSIKDVQLVKEFAKDDLDVNNSFNQ